MDPWYYEPEEDTTFYGRTLPAATITLNANTQGHFWEGSEHKTYSYDVAVGDVFRVVSEGEAPVSDTPGTVFSGKWYYDPDCTEFAADENHGLTVNSDVTLYAGWETGILVTFDANGCGSFAGGGTTATCYVRSGSAPRNVPAIVSTDPDHTSFTEWYLTPECTGAQINVRGVPITEETTYYAKLVLQYTLTLDANGGYFYDDPTNTTEVWHFTEGGSVNLNDQPFSYILSEITAPEQGLAFAGWYFDRAFTQPAGSITITEDKTVYAKWAEGWEITLNVSGGYFAGTENQGTRTLYVPKGQKLNPQLLPQFAFMDDIYLPLQILGWYADPACTVSINTNNFKPESAFTLYAEMVKPYKIHFDAQGGYFFDDPSDTEYDVYATSGDISRSPAPENSDPSRRFNGWYTDAACSGSAVTELNDSMVDPDSPENIKLVNLYAGWSLPNTITFIIEGGTFSENSQSVYSVEFNPGDAVAFPCVVPDDENSIFENDWYLNDQYEGAPIYPWSNLPQSDVTLYGHTVPAARITLNANGGFFGPDPEYTTRSYQIPIGTSFPDSEMVVQRAGNSSLVFSGKWYYDPDCTEFAADEDHGLTVNSAVTLYAGWETGILVTFDANDCGTFEGGGTSASQYVRSGSRVRNMPVLFSNDPDPEHQYFTEWYMTPECIPATLAQVRALPITAETTFYAKQIRQYELTVDANGGYFYDDPEHTTEVLHINENAVVDPGSDRYSYLVSRIENDNDERAAFAGWYYDADCTQPVGLITITEDLTVYAKWVTDGWRITFDANGGRISNYGDQTTYSFYSAKGRPITKRVPSCVNDSNTVGWYWYLTPDCSGQRVDFSTYIPTGDVTFYVKYARAWNTLYHGNGGFIDYGNGDISESLSLTLTEEDHFYAETVGFTHPDGLAFTGWYADPQCTELVFAYGQRLDYTSPAELYAGWTYGSVITFEVSGGVFAGYNTSVLTRSLPYGARLSNRDLPTTVILNDKGMPVSILGWYADAAFTQYVDVSGLTPDGDMTLYAKTQVPYEIYFDANGGAFVIAPEQPYYTTSGDISRIPEPQKADSRFGGWYTNENGDGSAVTRVNDSHVVLDPDPPSDYKVVNLYANWVENSYTIRFHASAQDEGVNFSVGVGKTFKLDYFPAARPGYTLKNWNTMANGKGTSYSVGATVKSLSKTDGAVVHLYAQWAPMKYKVVFDANGGKGSMKSQTMTFDKTTALTANAFTKSGYLFAGWSKDPYPEIGDILYRNAEKVKNLNCDPADPTTCVDEVRLYAIWTPIRYRIVFNANGGQGDMSGDGGYCGYDSPYTIPYNTYWRDGYTFAGWNTKANGKGTFFGDGETIENLTTGSGKTITLYAQWVAHRYNVRFDPNGGTGSMDDMLNLACGKSYKLPAVKFTRAGYKFLGWSTTPDGEVEYKNKSKHSNYATGVGETVTLYAVWSMNEYTITYKNVVSGDNNPNPQTYNVHVRIELEPLVRDGWIFNGWYLDSKFKKPVENGIIPEGSTGNKTLYARWKEVDPPSYRISFYDVDPATGAVAIDPLTGESRVKNQEGLKVGKGYTLSANSFAHPGYKFLGWSKVLGDGKDYNNKQKNVSITEDTSLYAVWAPIEYKITYKGVTPALGELGDDYATTYTIEAPLYLPTPQRPGYKFEGWYLDSKFKNPVENMGDQWVIPEGSTGNKTLYAKWSGKVTYTINFNGNDATSGKTKAMKGCVNGSRYTLNSNGFKRTGYLFAGWYDPVNYKVYGNKEKVGNLTAENEKTVTLYAIWSPARYTLTYKNVGPAETPWKQSYTIEDETFELETPWREGYVFEGWFLDAKFKKPVYEIAKGSTGNKTLYAKWSLLPDYGGEMRYVVTLHGNGGITAYGGELSPVLVFQFDEGDYFWGHSYGFENNGRAFAGWYKESSCKTLVCSYLDMVYVSSNLNLYAKWVDGWKITFNAPGGGHLNGNEADEPVEVYVPKGRTFGMYCPEVYYDGDYICIGWIDEATGEIFDPDEDVPTHDMELTAIRVESVDLTFDANGGYFYESGEELLTQRIPKGTTAPEYPDIGPCDPTLLFRGWYEDPDCTGEAFDLDNTPIESSMTLYAKWERALDLTVGSNNIVVNGGMADFAIFTPAESGYYVIRPDQASGFWLAIEDFSYEMYVDAWQYGEDPARLICYLEAGETYKISVANWNESFNGTVSLSVVKTAVYTVKIEANGGYLYGVDSMTFETILVPVGEALRFTGAVEHHDQHTALVGWYLDAAGTGDQIAGEYDLYDFVPESDMTLYAKWASAWKLTLNAAKNNGHLYYDEGPSTDWMKVLRDNSVYFPEVYWGANGYTTEWYNNSKFSGSPIRNGFVPTKDMTLYAKRVPGCTLTLDANGGQFVYEEPGYAYTSASFSIDIPKGKNLASVYDRYLEFFSLTQEGKDFAGWCLDPEGTQVVCEGYLDAEDYVVNSNTTLYAKWVEHSGTGTPEVGG